MVDILHSLGDSLAILSVMSWELGGRRDLGSGEGVRFEGREWGGRSKESRSTHRHLTLVPQALGD